MMNGSADNDTLGCWGQGVQQTRDEEMGARYGDKAQGLSINQRLSQMEFSDDEDEDEVGESRLLANLNAAREKKVEHAPVLESVAVEAFVADDGSDSD